MLKPSSEASRVGARFERGFFYKEIHFDLAIPCIISCLIAWSAFASNESLPVLVRTRDHVRPQGDLRDISGFEFPNRNVQVLYLVFRLHFWIFRLRFCGSVRSLHDLLLISLYCF